MVTFPSSGSEDPSSCVEKEQADSRLQAVTPGLSVCAVAVTAAHCLAQVKHTLLSLISGVHTYWRHIFSIFHPKYYEVVPSTRLFFQEDLFLRKSLKCHYRDFSVESHIVT